MEFQKIYSDVENTCNLNGQRNLVKRAVNRAQDKVFSFSPWKFSLEDSFFSTVDDYTTGTASITNDSKTVTGSGTAFTAAMVGRKIRFNGEQAFYKIATQSSATAITLEQPYQGDTDTAATIEVFQDEYRLNGDVDIEHMLRSIENGVALFEFPVREFDIVNPTPDAFGTADSFLNIGQRQDTYTTGTVAITSGTKTISGSSTSWEDVQGLSRGNRIIIGTQVFTIKSVDSDTQLTTYEAASSTISAGTAYTIILDNPIVQINRLPDAVRNIHYRYYRVPAPLVEDTDEPEVPSSFQWLLLEGAKIEAWEHKGMIDRSNNAKSNFADGLKLMKQRYNTTFQNIPKRSQLGSLGRTGPTYPANYDVRHSF